MQSMKCQDMITQFEKLFPPSAAEAWDNVGLLLGRRNKEIKSVYIALDATDKVVADAVIKKADMLLTHHPLLFSPLKSISTDDFIGRRVIALLQNDISYYVMHTNYDVCRMSELAAEYISLGQPEVLQETGREKLYKLAVYVPETHREQVREALTQAGAGFIGGYSHCTFTGEGTGTFRPLTGTSPFIGQEGELSRVEEVKIETVVKESWLPGAVHKMLEVHPYEEPAYDIYRLEQTGRAEGFGRTGFLSEPMTLRACCELMKGRFRLSHVKAFGSMNKMVHRAVIFPGSGKSSVDAAVAAGADVLITGDIDHHTGIDSAARGLCVIDAGHYGIEHIYMKDMKSFVEKTWKGVTVYTPQIESPFQIV